MTKRMIKNQTSSYMDLGSRPDELQSPGGRREGKT